MGPTCSIPAWSSAEFFDTFDEFGNPGPDGLLDHPRDGSGFTVAATDPATGGYQNSQLDYYPAYYHDGTVPADLLYSNTLSSAGRQVNNAAIRNLRCRPLTMHTCSHYHYHNGKVWYPFANSVSWNPSHAGVLALNMNQIRSNPGYYRAWRFDDPAPWEWIGINGPSFAQAHWFGVAAVDRLAGKVYYTGQSSDTIFQLDTTTETLTRITMSELAGKSRSSGCSQIAQIGSSRYWVILGTASKEIYVINITNPGSLAYVGTFAWDAPVNYQWSLARQTNVPSGTLSAAWGLAWHTKSQKFLLYNCDSLNEDPNGGRQQIRVLTPPLVAGELDTSPGATWAASRFLPAPGGLGSSQFPDLNNLSSNIGGGGGSYTRFGIIENFAESGDDLLVQFSRWDSPMWVVKLAGPVQDIQ